MTDARFADIIASEEDAPDARDFGLHVPAPIGDMALRATNMGIRYNLNFTKKTKLRTTFANLLDPRRRNKGHFWALRGINLTVNRGEAVGIIGPNGSGKSTMLLALSGIVQPSEGVVEVNGHVSTLLSLQAGFDADLSGRENIALAGALMGIDHKLMEEITPGIIQFASIGAFIDAPMKTYSSGMRARVGFSIATAVDPDILLLDEVLSTGDNKFKDKSRTRIAEVLTTAKAVVMVTHDMSWITSFCTRAILLDKGSIVAIGDPDEIADMHETDADRRRIQKRKAKQLMKHGIVEVKDVQKARREGTMAEIYEANKEASATLTARNRSRRKAEKAAGAAGAAVAAVSYSSDPASALQAVTRKTAKPKDVAAAVADRPDKAAKT